MERIKRLFSILLIFSFMNVTMMPTAQAGLVSTEQVARSVAIEQGESAHAKLNELLARADVQAQLEKAGVSVADARDRVGALSSEEATVLAQQIENAPAGAGVVGAIVLIFLVLLVTDILGLTNIFPFTR